MKKLLLLLLLSLGLIESSWSETRAPTDEQLLDRLNNQIADNLAVREETTRIYWMEVNELIEKRKLLNPESNQEEIDEIIKLATDAHKKCFDAVNILFDEGSGLSGRINKIRYELYISESRDKLEEVINRCSLSRDESCDADVKKAQMNFHRAKESYDTTIYYRITKNQFLQFACPGWSFLYSKSMEEITDSDS